MWYKKDQIRQEAGKLMEPSQAGGMLTEELFKMATKGLYNLGRASASKVLNQISPNEK